MDSSTIVKALIEQGKNTLDSLKNLTRKANNKGEKRAALYENFRANTHSFRVYTFADPEIGEADEVQAFLKQILTINELFTGVDTVHDTKVNADKVKEAYEQAVSAYNEMIKKFKKA